jgi:hypothetical protein
MRAMTDSTSKQNTAPSQGDDAAASHIPCPTEPRIAPIVFEVDEDNRVNVSVINPSVPSLVFCHSRLRHVAEQPFGFDVVPVPAEAPDQAKVATDLARLAGTRTTADRTSELRELPFRGRQST